MADILFWTSMACLASIYLGPPAVAWLFSRVRPRPVRQAAITPSVTVVIAAYNEADHIVATVRNKLASDYPEESLDVMVVSDCSDDRTDELLASLGSPRLTWFRLPRR